MSMSPGSKAGVGAALQTVGQGLMQYTQFSIEEQRQKNLEAIRQRERGEDKSERDARLQTEDARYRESTDFQKERATKEDEARERARLADEKRHRETLGAAKDARLDAREMKILENFENIPNSYSRRLELLDKAEVEGTSTPEQIQKVRLQIARESASRQEDFIRRHPFLKGYTVSDYLDGDGGKPAPAAATAAPVPGQQDPGKKPLPDGLMAPVDKAAVPDAAAKAVEEVGLQPTESIGTIFKEGLSSVGDAISSGVKGATDGLANANALANVKYVMNRLGKTGTMPIDAVRSIAESNVSEKELRSVGADDRVIKVIQQIRSSQ